MYRIIEKVNGKSTFFVQKKYGFFWLKIISSFGYIFFSAIFLEILAIIFFIFSITVGTFFPVGVIPLTLGIVIAAVGSTVVENFKKFIKFNSLYDAKQYIIMSEKVEHSKLERKTIIHYMSEREERADKLRKLNRKNLFRLK